MTWSYTVPGSWPPSICCPPPWPYLLQSCCQSLWYFGISHHLEVVHHHGAMGPIINHSHLKSVCAIMFQLSSLGDGGPCFRSFLHMHDHHEEVHLISVDWRNQPVSGYKYFKCDKNSPQTLSACPFVSSGQNKHKLMDIYSDRPKFVPYSNISHTVLFFIQRRFTSW